MNLIYRGTPYGVTFPTIETAISEHKITQEVTFLGAQRKTQPFNLTYRHRPYKRLTYRGVKYVR